MTRVLVHLGASLSIVDSENNTGNYYSCITAHFVVCYLTPLLYLIILRYTFAPQIKRYCIAINLMRSSYSFL